MIIQGSRMVESVGPEPVIRHVFHGPNKHITVVQGCEDDVRDMYDDARDGGKKYAVRHWKLSAYEDTTREQAMELVKDLAREFKFDPKRAAVVEHEKDRVGGQACDRHWHVLVPEYDVVTGRVLDSRWSYARHEKLARAFEKRHGHKVVRGRFVRPKDVPEDEEKPVSAYSHVEWQRAAHDKVSLPKMRLKVAEAWGKADGPEALQAALLESGLSVRPGDKAGIWLAETSSAEGKTTLLGALHRLVHEKKDSVNSYMTGGAHVRDTESMDHARRRSGHARPRRQRESPEGRRPGTDTRDVAGDGRRSVRGSPDEPVGEVDRKPDVGATDTNRRAPGPDRGEARDNRDWLRYDELREERAAADEWNRRRVVVQVAEDQEARLARRRRYIALILHDRMHLAKFLPAEEVLGIRYVKVLADALIMTLTSGTRITDRGDTLELQGLMTQRDVQELVAHVLRHGWTSVVMSGTAEFRMAVGAALKDAGVEIVPERVVPTPKRGPFPRAVELQPEMDEVGLAAK